MANPSCAAASVARLVAVRGIGKREAMQRRGMGSKKPEKAMTTRNINLAWTKAGNGSSANVLLGQLVKARQIKRTKFRGQRGSEYRAA